MAIDNPFEILSSEDRANAIYTMKEAEQDQFTYDELTDEMASQGYVDEELTDEFQAALHHTHLPKMEEYGVVSVEDQTVEYLGDPEVEELLDTNAAV